jgi:two-component system CheB/CheR fusion protein
MINLIHKHRDQKPNKNLDKYFNVMTAAGRDMSRMIDSLLEYSRSGKLDEPLEEIKIKDFEGQLKGVFLPEIQHLGGQMILDIPFITIKVFPILFKRLFTNLINNAIKYRGDHAPQITINVEEKADAYIFAVQDNGIGIPNDQFENIFRIFRSLKPDAENNGIGLAVCKTIVELHDGKIWVNSEQGIGSIFHFTIKKFE